jgi:hypothetical protein
MSPLARESVALLDAARDADGPDPVDRARIRRRLLQAGVGAAVGTGAATTAATAKALTSTVGAGGVAAGAGGGGAATVGAVGGSSLGLFAAKIVATVVLVGGLGAGGAKGIAAYQESRHPSSAQVSAAVQKGPAVTAGLTGGATPTAQAQGTELSVAAEDGAGFLKAPEPPATGAPLPVAVPHRAVAGRTGGADVPSTLEAETRLLREAEVSLRAGDAQRALALLDEHAARFAGGILQEERAAERILALCALGRTGEARAEVDRFLLERPRSPLADRVRASCAARDGR